MINVFLNFDTINHDYFTDCKTYIYIYIIWLKTFFVFLSNNVLLWTHILLSTLNYSLGFHHLSLKKMTTFKSLLLPCYHSSELSQRAIIRNTEKLLRNIKSRTQAFVRHSPETFINICSIFVKLHFFRMNEKYF